MSEIRLEFYQAVNKANYYKPKKKEVKVVKENISVEEQIAFLLKESESAVVVDEVEIQNEQVVDWFTNLYKKDEKTLLKEKETEKFWREIEEKRELARKEWRNLQRMQEKASNSRGGATFNPSAAASSSAAGAGGSGNKVISNYYVQGYIDPGYIE